MYSKIILVTAFLGVICAQALDDIEEFCYEPPETGQCRAYFPQIYYNITTDTCEEFIYGGCPGSRNRFSTEEACIRACRPHVCSLAPEVGPCRGNIRVWYYDPEVRQCKQFSWGGCEGNDNKFRSQSACETACAGTGLPCDLGDSFRNMGGKAVHEGFRDKEWFVGRCTSKCRDACLASHPWGVCLSFSVRKRWWGGCNCYLYDRFLSTHEFDPDTSGTTRNRQCAVPEEERVSRMVEN